MDELKSPIGVLNTDAPIRSLRDGDYPFALNAINESTEGEQLVKSREKSDTIISTLPEGHVPLGHVYTTDNRMVVFSTNGVDSQIGLTDGKDYEVLLQDSDCLNFLKNKKISATFRRRLGCEDTVYFTDGVNPVRKLEITDLEKYKDEDGNFDCDLLELIRGYMFPCTSRIRVVEGGGRVPFGSYNIAITYLDADYNAAGWIWASKIVTVGDDIGGGINKVNNLVIGKEEPSRSIEVEFENLDQSYPFYKVAVVAANSGSGFANQYLASPVIPTQQSTFVYTGNNDGFTELTLEEIRATRADIATAETLAQIENTLILGNVQGRQYNFCDWQKAASKICTNYTVKEVAQSEYKRGTSSWVPTLIGDEVEEYGIMYLLPGGYLSPVYHIPGRALDYPSCSLEDIGDMEQDKYCLTVVGRPPDEGDCLGTTRVRFDLKVTQEINGTTVTLYEGEQRLSYSDDQEPAREVYCVNYRPGDAVPEFTVTNWRVTVSSSDPDCEQFGDAFWKVEYRQARSDGRPRPIQGIDSTVYPYWTEDMAHLISEERWEEVMKKYEEEYFGSSTPNRNDGEFLTWLSQNAKALPKRWQIYNTAIPSSDTSGSMGYYECTRVTYNNPHTECVDDYWGEDYLGNKLEGTPIRHHRTPDRSIEPITVERDGKKYVRALGVAFANIEYPHPDIIGHFFVRVKKTDANSTVLDTGICEALNRENDDSVTQYNNLWTGSSRRDTTDFYFLSPATQYKRILPDADYVRFMSIRDTERELRFDGSNNAPEYEVEDNAAGTTVARINIFERFYRNENQIPAGDINRNIEDKVYVDALRQLNDLEGFDRPLSNQNMIDFRLFLSLSDGTTPTDAGDLRLATMKRDIEVGCNLDSSEYIPMHDCPFTEDQTEAIYAGDGYLSELNIEDLQLNANWFRNNTFLFWSNTALLFTARSVKNFWIESRYDNSLRVQGPDSSNNHYVLDEDLGQYYMQKISDPISGTSRRNLKRRMHQTGWIYNNDYLRVNDTKIYFPLASVYDCCSLCLEAHPNRFHYSLQSFDEERADYFGIFLPNNYVDVEADTGDIVDMAVYNKEVIYWTEEAQWKMPYGYVERVNTDGAITFIGDGAFLSRPPMKLQDSQAGSYGMMFKNSWVKTPNGLVSVDPRSGKVILYNQGIKVLSDVKNRNYFKNNLLKGVEDITVGYDERHERLLVTKLGGEVDRNLSFTMSYSFLSQGWIGWHSYLPKLYLTGKDLLLKVEDGQVARMNSAGHYCIFNNKKYPHIVEVVFNVQADAVKILEDITLTTSALKYSPEAEDFSIVDNVTFDEITVYTEKQCSGKLKLLPLEDGEDFLLASVEQKEGESIISRLEREWRVNDFHDLVVDYEEPFFRKDWEAIKDNYFIDKVINEEAVDYGKEWFDLQPIRDKYFVVRLSINSQHFLKLVTYSLKAKVSESIR